MTSARQDSNQQPVCARGLVATAGLHRELCTVDRQTCLHVLQRTGDNEMKNLQNSEKDLFSGQSVTQATAAAGLSAPGTCISTSLHTCSHLLSHVALSRGKIYGFTRQQTKKT